MTTQTKNTTRGCHMSVAHGDNMCPDLLQHITACGWHYKAEIYAVTPVMKTPDIIKMVDSDEYNWSRDTFEKLAEGYNYTGNYFVDGLEWKGASPVHFYFVQVAG